VLMVVTFANLSSADTFRIELSNLTVPQKVFLNDIVSASVFLYGYGNQSNMTMEAIPCSVIATDNDTGSLTKVWDTTCRSGEPYLDNFGNWAAITDTCKFSDSAGMYYFDGTITEADGFQYGKYYNLVVTCGGTSNSSTFYVDVPKPYDVEKWYDVLVRRAGEILLFAMVVGIAIFMLLVIIAVLWLLWYVIKKAGGKR